MKYDYEIDKLNTFITTHLERYSGRLISMNAFTFTADFFCGSYLRHRMTLRKSPSSDLEVYRQIFELLEYKPLIDLIIKDNPTKSLNIIDAGANIGATTIYLHKYFPESKIVLVEPDENNTNILRLNIKHNNVNNNTIIKGGIWPKDTFLEIKRDFRDKNDWSVRVNETSRVTTLKGYSIPSLMNLVGFDSIDLLKIDIEGSEKELFDNHEIASVFLSKTKYLAIEIHDEFNCRENIICCLTKNDFELFEVNETIFGINKSLTFYS